MHSRGDPWRGVVLGLIGGAAGVMAMDLYMRKVGPLLFGDQERAEGGDRGQRRGSPAGPLADISLVGQHHRGDESATAALGRMAYREVTGNPPDAETKTTLSHTIHWGYGVLQGGLYGVARAQEDGIDLPAGLIFGTGLWLFGDELAVPLLGVQEGPTAYPAEVHLNRLVGHLVYGATTAATTHLLHRLIG
jgi:hypothetical protein